jgi:hypothetical protein
MRCFGISWLCCGASCVAVSNLQTAIAGFLSSYARWHMFEEKREAVLAIEAAVLPSMPKDKALAA